MPLLSLTAMDDELPDGLFRTKLIPPSQAFDPPLCLPRRIVVLNSEQHPHPQHIHPLRPPLQDRLIVPKEGDARALACLNGKV